MAKMILSVSLVNGSAFPDREISAHEVMQAFVGDVRPPAEGVWIAIYTDDGRRVDIGVPVRGGSAISATVRDWDGASPKAQPPAQTMCVTSFNEIIAVLGHPTSFDEAFGGTDKWECGCYAQPRLGYSRSDNDIEFEWIQCRQHTAYGPGTHRDAPESP